MDSYQQLTPVMFVDPLGLDAILINKEIEAGPLVEHMAAFFQNESGGWYYFSWESTVKYHKVEDNSIFESLDKVNEYLLDKKLIKNKNKPYRDSVYIKGDFSASNDKASTLYEEYKKSLSTWDGKGYKNQEYDLFLNNCTQVAINTLMEGVLPGGTNVGNYLMVNDVALSNLPNTNMNTLQGFFCNKAINKKEFNAAMGNERGKYEEDNLWTNILYYNHKQHIKEISGRE